MSYIHEDKLKDSTVQAIKEAAAKDYKSIPDICCMKSSEAFAYAMEGLDLSHDSEEIYQIWILANEIMTADY